MNENLEVKHICRYRWYAYPTSVIEIEIRDYKIVRISKARKKTNERRIKADEGDVLRGTNAFE